MGDLARGSWGLKLCAASGPSLWWEWFLCLTRAHCFALRVLWVGLPAHGNAQGCRKTYTMPVDVLQDAQKRLMASERQWVTAAILWVLQVFEYPDQEPHDSHSPQVQVLPRTSKPL